MDLMTVALIIVGLILLVIGGDILVRGAVQIAELAGLSSLVIGLTVVAFGTSAPELVVSLQAGLSGNSNIAVANVVGSNIFNVLFILGLCALIYPLAVTSQLVKIDLPVMVFASLLTLLFAYNSKIEIHEGVILFLLLLVYVYFIIKKSRAESKAAKKEFESHFHAEAHEKKLGSTKKRLTIALKGFGFVALGLLLLVLGARWLIEGAIELAKNFGVSDTVIGLTIVAAGTSLPEVATSVIATYKKELNIAIGNVVGSNIYNIFCILGLSSIITPNGLNVAPEIISFDLPIMIAVAVVCLPVFFTGFKIARWEGALFLIGYIAYTLYLINMASSVAL